MPFELSVPSCVWSVGIQYDFVCFQMMYFGSFGRLTLFSSFFGDGPQCAAVMEYACNMNDLMLTVLVIFLLSDKLVRVLKASIARISLRMMSFSVSSNLPNDLHCFLFSIPLSVYFI